MGDLLTIGTNALGTFQQGLAVTSNNVANVNTPGYSRQELQIHASTPTKYGGLLMGNGAQSHEIRRIAAEYLDRQIQTATADYNQQKQANTLATQLDAIVGSANEGISSQLGQYFSALQTLANDPTSPSPRSLTLAEGDSLVTQVQSFDRVRSSLYEQTNGQIDATLTQINSMVEQFQLLNNEAIRTKNASGDVAAALQDKREQMLGELSQYLEVKAFEQPNGSIDIHTANGSIPLLSDNTPTRLFADFEDFHRGAELSDGKAIFMEHPIGSKQYFDISDRDFGGQLGGTMDFKKNALNLSEDELGMTMMGMAALLNTQHRQGYDLDGNQGNDLFTVNGQSLNPNFFAAFEQNAFVDKHNTGTAALVVGIDQTGISQADVRGAGDVATMENTVSKFKATRYEVTYDGANFSVQDLNSKQVVATGTGLTPLTFDGLQLTLNAGTANQGDRFLLTPYADAVGQFDQVVSDGNDFAARAEDPANPGTPLGEGDNTNIAEVALYAERKIMYGKSEDIQGSFTLMSTHVGSYVQGTEIARDSNESLLNNLNSTREEVSGVNLDEEAANLLRFQQAYQAAAQIISTSQSLFQTLIGAVRG